MRVLGTAVRTAVAGMAMAAGLTAMPAAGQTVVVPAVPATLGAIPDSPSGCGTPGGPRDVRFQVAGVLGSADSMAVSLTMTHSYVGDLRAVLIAPTGESHVVFARTGAADLSSYGDSSNLGGTYRFADWATLGWWSAAAAAGSGQNLPAGDYRTSFPAGSILAGLPSFLSVAFKSSTVNGTWTLRLTDECVGDSGVITGASLEFRSGSVTESAASNSTGAIPDGGPSCATSGAPRDLLIDFGRVFGEVENVSVELNLSHPFVGHLRAYVIAPDGASHLIFGRTGATSANSPGDDSNLASSYTFNDAGFNTWWNAALAAGPNGIVLPVYVPQTSELGGPGATGAATAMNPVFAGAAASGVWTVRLIDDCAGETGTASSASLYLQVRNYTVPTTVGDAYATVTGTPLGVGGAGVLANDVNSRSASPLRAVLVSNVSHGTLSLQPSGAFTYTPAPGFVGADSFAYAAANDGGNGNIVTVSIAVNPPTTLQAPTALRVDDVQGQTVRLRWEAPAIGPAPTGYVLEGGVQPGQTIAALGTGLSVPVFTFDAPAGSFYLRVRAVNGADVSAPSNEVPLHVAVAVPPSAPAGLLATVDGSALSLAWRPTFLGGAATSAVLDVTGAATASLPLGPGETFTAPSVPPGTYTLRVRGANAGGPGAASAPVTVTVPGGCSGAPQTPVGVLAYRVGSRLELLWEPAPAGPSAMGYVVDVVSPVYTGTVQFTTRRLSAAVPPGSYTLRVAATNACGTSGYSAAQTVVVP